ncbi:MAG TPA: purine-nucleoside phosphorylase [Anaerolineales bacterium]|nr:purine-nucleoside phosphorylase [Anaerolineales bacterium]
MSDYFTLEEIDRITDLIREQVKIQPRTGIILGSGLGSLAESVDEPVKFSYGQLPSWPVSTVEGHAGRLVIGELENHPVVIMQGRIHYYEGYSMPQIGLPIRVLSRLGIKILIITNAAGAVNPEFEPGDLMLIRDHLNLIGMAGLNPLRGPNLDELGPRFPDMSRAYDRDLIDLARQVATENDIFLREGVYVCLAGPSFETPADLRFLLNSGVDAVGMSTVPEVIVAHHAGLRVLGISGISNKANLDGETVTTHEEVLAAGEEIVPKLTTLVRGVLRRL